MTPTPTIRFDGGDGPMWAARVSWSDRLWFTSDPTATGGWITVCAVEDTEDWIRRRPHLGPPVYLSRCPRRVRC